jgi:hypothetical protein
MRPIARVTRKTPTVGQIWKPFFLANRPKLVAAWKKSKRLGYFLSGWCQSSARRCTGGYWGNDVWCHLIDGFYQKARL